MLTVVIMDDEYYFRQAVKKYLSECDGKYEVIGEAKNGREGVEVVDTLQPDVVLVDINMPVMTGIEVAEELNRRHFPGKVIILSGYGEFEYAQKSIKFGVWDYLLKPVSRQQLLESMEKAAEQIYMERDQYAQYKELQYEEYTTKNMLVEYLVDKVIHSDWPEVEQILKKFPEMRERKNYLTMLLDIYYDDTDYWKASDAPLCSFVVTNVLKEILSDGKISCFMRIDKNKTICAILSSDLEDAVFVQAVHHSLEKFYDLVQSRLFLSVLCSVGTVKKELKNCAASYEEALAIKKFWFLYHGKGIYYKSLIEQNKISKGAFLGQRSVRLQFLMKMNDREGIKTLLANIFSEMKKDGEIPEAVFRRTNDIISCAFEFARDIQNDIVKIEQDTLPPSPELVSGTIDEIHQKVLSYVLEVIDTAHIKMKEKQSLLPEKVVHYIDRNYFRPDLALEDLTKEFGVSRTVLCQQFKEVVKMTVGEYMLQTRMLRAKALLDDGYGNIAYVAEKCGYEDAGYFSKRFRKYFGISPSDYLKMKTK